MYRDGFRSMTVGRTLWLVIAIKVAVIFLIIRLLLMPDRLAEAAPDDEGRARIVRSSLAMPADNPEKLNN